MQKKISAAEIANYEQRYRACFINSLGGFKSLALIGTQNSTGKSNLAIFNSIFHLGANPPLFGFIIRPDSAERHTLQNISINSFFTVNHVREEFCKAAHQTSARYPSSVSEFAACNLQEEYKDDFAAPFVKESAVQIGAELVRIQQIPENGTLLIIAKILHVYCPDECISPDGFVDLEKAGSITVAGLDTYYKTKRIARFTYAKPDLEPREI